MKRIGLVICGAILALAGAGMAGAAPSAEGDISSHLEVRWDGMHYRWYASDLVVRSKGNDQQWAIEHVCTAYPSGRTAETVAPYWTDNSHKVGLYAWEVKAGATCTDTLIEQADGTVLDAVTYTVPVTP